MKNAITLVQHAQNVWESCKLRDMKNDDGKIIPIKIVWESCKLRDMKNEVSDYVD